MPEANTTVWFALQTFYSKEQKVGLYLKEQRVDFFIPMIFSISTDKDGNAVRKFRTAIHNLLFIKQSMPQETLNKIVGNCPYPVRVYRKYDHPNEWYPIEDSEILELRMICDSSFQLSPVFREHTETSIQVGKKIRVVHGPMKGIRGVLVRKNKKYFIIKTIANLDIVFSVSRWCCESDE